MGWSFCFIFKTCNIYSNNKKKSYKIDKEERQADNNTNIISRVLLEKDKCKIKAFGRKYE